MCPGTVMSRGAGLGASEEDWEPQSQERGDGANPVGPEAAADTLRPCRPIQEGRGDRHGAALASPSRFLLNSLSFKVQFKFHLLQKASLIAQIKTKSRASTSTSF